MAEIHVQAKKHQHANSAWIWIVALVLIAAAVIYYLSTRNNKGENNTQNQTNTTSGMELPQQFTGATHVISTVV